MASADASQSVQPGAGRMRWPSEAPSSNTQPTSTGKPFFFSEEASKSRNTRIARENARSRRKGPSQRRMHRRDRLDHGADARRRLDRLRLYAVLLEDALVAV